MKPSKQFLALGKSLRFTLLIAFSIPLFLPVAVSAGEIDPRELEAQGYDMSDMRWIVRVDIRFEGDSNDEFYTYVKKVLKERTSSLTPINDESSEKINVVAAVRCAPIMHNGPPRKGLAKFFLGPYTQQVTQVLVRLRKVQGHLHLQIMTRTGERSSPDGILRNAEDSVRAPEISQSLAADLINTPNSSVDPKKPNPPS